MKTVEVQLKNNIKVYGDCFEFSEFGDFQKIYQEWIYLNSLVKEKGGRNINVPDVLSEGLFCLLFNAVRTNNDKNAGSYDCVLVETGDGVQVKASSVAKDLTSFGPRSKWDLLCFADFAHSGMIDGKAYFYIIDNQLIERQIVNKGENQTFTDQQTEKRRPRFSIKEKIIAPYQVKHICSLDILGAEIINVNGRYRITSYGIEKIECSQN